MYVLLTMDGGMQGERTTATVSLDNARREVRFAGERTFLMMPWGGDFESHRVRLLDCSAHGIGFLDTVPQEPGTQFVVYLRLGEVTMVLYTVRHCTRLPCGDYKIGARLSGFVGKVDDHPDRVLTSLLQDGLV
jgi:hypothetical protein